ncbi:MAG: hypothetical protein RLZZ605_988 [Bacteroidota bacterium]|jgi:hypothetical protein
METYTLTKKQLIEFVTNYNNKENTVYTSAAIRVKKGDVDKYGNDKDQKAWVQILPIADYIVSKSPQIVRVTQSQFAKILDSVAKNKQEI